MYGVDIPKGVWNTLESLESGSVIFECKEGPFVEHEVDGVMRLVIDTDSLVDRLSVSVSIGRIKDGETITFLI